MKFITKDTIATIEPIETDKIVYRLTMYKDCKPIFTKDYKAFAAAKAQETKYQRKFNLL